MLNPIIFVLFFVLWKIFLEGQRHRVWHAPRKQVTPVFLIVSIQSCFSGCSENEQVQEHLKAEGSGPWEGSLRSRQQERVGGAGGRRGV